jgi:hypothetical protein
MDTGAGCSLALVVALVALVDQRDWIRTCREDTQGDTDLGLT